MVTWIVTAFTDGVLPGERILLQHHSWCSAGRAGGMGLGIRSQGARFPDHVNALCLERWARGGGGGGGGTGGGGGVGLGMRRVSVTRLGLLSSRIARNPNTSIVETW